ncbi:hypothetical protein LY474_11540 [Myxococcus stipitatus]|nr:hypothetical protein [Myxococcus stipitatus]
MARRAAGPHLGTVARALRVEPESRVRAALVRMLGPVATADDSAKALLRDVATTDDAEDVRRLAASLLTADE